MTDSSENTLIRRLRTQLRDDQLAVDLPTRERYSHDDAEWAPFTVPVLVVFAESLDDVVATVSAAAATGTPLVSRGSGTGLSGGANSVEDGIIVSLERMTAITEINVPERYAVVQAGVLNDQLRHEASVHGLWYPPDPASSAISTIGGNVATNAGGICCVKYGVTRDYVMGMTVVLADGTVARLGRRTAKGVTGYDLSALLVGSEGTLGIIVDVTLKLIPFGGRQERAIIGYFESVQQAGVAVAAVTAAGIVPSALELIDGTCLRAVEQWQHWTLPGGADALLLAKVDDAGVTGDALSGQIAALFEASGGLRVQQSSEPAQVEQLFQARRLAYPALERLGPVLTEDICVPRGAVAAMLERIQQAAADNDVTIANIAHAGDGNLHPLIIVPEGDDAARDRAKIAFDRIVDDCRELGGTVTGEHGVGLLKLDGAAAELSPVVVRMHEAIKAALDPAGILNPGKAFPAESLSAEPVGAEGAGSEGRRAAGGFDWPQ